MIIYLHFLYLFFIYLVQTKRQQCHCNRRCSSRRRQKEIIVSFWCYIDTLLRLWWHILLMNIFFCMNRFINNNCYCFCCYHRKIGNFISCFDQKLFLQFHYFNCFEQHKVIDCVILTIYIHLFLFSFSKIWFENDYTLPLHTIVASSVSEN